MDFTRILADKYMGGSGPWSRIPPEPLTSRWGYVGLSALFNILLREKYSSAEGRIGEPFIPGFQKWMHSEEKMGGNIVVSGRRLE